MRLRRLPALFFLLSSPLFAQFTTTTATVGALANATYTWDFVNLASTGPPLLGGISVFPTQVVGSFDSSGRLSAALADNNQVLPLPSQWKLNVTFSPCVGVTQGFNIQLTITGSTQSITSTLAAAVPASPPACSGGGGGAGNPAPPGGSEQFANLNATGFSSIGLFDSDVFINGSGNNGLRNAQALGLQNLIMPPTSPSLEDIFSSLTVTGSQAFDYRGGSFLRNHFNYDHPEGFNAELDNCELTQSIPQGTGSNCFLLQDVDSTTGAYIDPIWNSHKAAWIETVKVAASIHQALHIDDFEQAEGDAGTFYMDIANSTVALAGGDESNQAMSIHQTQPNPLNGLILSGGGGPGVELIQTDLLNDVGGGRDIVSNSEIEASGLILANTPGTGVLPNIITTSDTHAASTAIGLLTSACGANVNPTTPITTTCPITTTSGTFTATPTGGQATAKVCIGDFTHYEQADVVSASSTSLVLKLSFSHSNGVEIFQGTCGGTLTQGNGWANPINGNQGQINTYPVVGAPTTTSLAYVIPWHEGQNGEIQILLPTLSVPISTASGSGSVITIAAGALASGFNNYALPDAAHFCITGNSNSALNNCNITATTVTGAGFQVNAASTSTGSGTGGTLFVGGLNNYASYCMATITQVHGVTALAQDGNGVLSISPNTCNWVNGAGLLMTNSYTQSFRMLRLSSIGNTPPLKQVGTNILITPSMAGATWDGSTAICWGCETHDELAMYTGFGGSFEGHLMNASDDVFHGYFEINEPIGSQAAFSGTNRGFLFRIFPETGNPVSSFDLFQFFGANGESDMSIDRDAEILSYNHTFFSVLDTSDDSTSFSYDNNTGLLISRDPDIATTMNCIKFNGAIPTVDSNCHNLSVTGIEADETGADPFLHIKASQHTGGVKFDVLNAGASAFDTPVTITDTQILMSGGTLPVPAMDTTTPVASQVACIKAVGPPIQLGTCSTVVGSSGACTCN